MKTTIHLLVVGVLGLLLLSGAQLGSPPPAQGKVLLLDSEHPLLGDVERVGDKYHVRGPAGETWVTADRVLAVCATLDDALLVLRRRSNLRDPDERLRLAGWCRQHGLIAQAAVEVRAALQLRPDHVPSQRLLQLLTDLQAAKPSAAGREADLLPAASVDLTAEALAQFATKVQPILMNACASCHAGSKGGTFKLTRVYEASLVPRRTTVGNAAAVLAQINLEQPGSSPLLTKAVGLHGDMTNPPFKDRQAVAYRTLEDWVRQVAAHAPAVPTSAPAPTPSAPEGGFASTRPNAGTPPVEQAVPRTPPVVATPAEPAPPRVVPTTPSPTPPPPMPAPTGPVDPHDPDTFNKQATTPPKPVPPRP